MEAESPSTLSSDSDRAGGKFFELLLHPPFRETTIFLPPRQVGRQALGRQLVGSPVVDDDVDGVTGDKVDDNGNFATGDKLDDDGECRR